MKHLETDSLSNQNISSALAIGSYTSDGDRAIYVDVCVDAVAGDGDYIMHVTKQIGGAGSAYVILPKTTMTAASGETAISGQSGMIIVRNTDVLKVYLKGLAGDTATPDTTVRWVDASKDIVLGATQTGVTIPTVTAITNGVTLSDDAITSAKFDESTAFPVKSADTGATQIARTGADSDTLETLSDQMDGIATWSAAAINASYSAGAISQIRGNTWGFDADNLTLDDTLIQLVIKNNANDQDDDAILMIDNVTGLLRVNGAAGTAGDASLAYAGTTLTIEVVASVTALLPVGVYHYGIQSIDGSGVVAETYGGTFTITADMVRATA